jgi:Dynamin GTPase effector domain
LTAVGAYIDLDELRAMIRREKARKLPGSVSSDLQERLIERSLAAWKRCAEEYVDNVCEAVQSILSKLCGELFSRYERSGLFAEVWYNPFITCGIINYRDIVNKVIKDLSLNAGRSVLEQIGMESRPFTQNLQYLTYTSETLLQRITEYRRKESSGTSFNQYHQEMVVISNVLAYIKLAYTRLADTIPMRVEEHFQYRLSETIQRQLLTNLLTGDGYEEKCKVYMEDAPELVAKRQELTKKLEILRLAEQEVKKFQVLE